MSEIIQTIVLLITAGGIIVLSYYATRWVGNGVRLKGKGGCIRVVDRAALSQDKSVALIRAGKRYFLIGVASGQISLLSELEGEDLSEEEPEEGEDQTSRTVPSIDFKELLKRAVGKKEGK